jgi:hypothetical protein
MSGVGVVWCCSVLVVLTCRVMRAAQDACRPTWVTTHTVGVSGYRMYGLGLRQTMLTLLAATLFVMCVGADASDREDDNEQLQERVLMCPDACIASASASGCSSSHKFSAIDVPACGIVTVSGS